jgi:hypothetical protein
MTEAGTKHPLIGFRFTKGHFILRRPEVLITWKAQIMTPCGYGRIVCSRLFDSDLEHTCCPSIIPMRLDSGLQMRNGLG